MYWRAKKDCRYLLKKKIFQMFYSPKDVHKASSDLSGTGFDSKSSNHKQRSHYSYDSSDLPAEKKSTLFLELQHLLY